ncbi:hypothetical protein, partial [Xanthomonas campestris]|uniref:hypothetical protein n=1 Tax=Xanthomonas campestris TaxID=339 RepID=UPI003CE8F25C
EKRRASMRAAPAGFAPNGLPLRYGAPEKLKAKAKAKQQAQATNGKRQAASGKRSRWLSSAALPCGNSVN